MVKPCFALVLFILSGSLGLFSVCDPDIHLVNRGLFQRGMENRVSRCLLSCGLALGFMTEAGTGNISFPDHVSVPFPESSEQISRLKVRFSKGRKLLKTDYGSVSLGLKALQETSLCRGFRGKNQDVAGKVVDPHSDLLSKASQGVFSVSVPFSRVETRMSGTLKEMFEWITNRKPPLLLPCSLVFCEEMS